MAVSSAASVGRPGRHPGADRGPALDLAALRRVLVVRADNLGDVVMATPALRALRAALPHARLDLLASPAGARLAPVLDGVDEVLQTSPVWQQLGDPPPGAARDEQALVQRLAGRGYDAMLVLTSFSQAPWPVAHVGLLAGIAVRVVQSREFGGAVATHWVSPPPDTTHQVDRDLHLLAAIGVPARGSRPSLSVPATADAAAARLLGPTGPVALLVPGASCSARRYPADRFGHAAARIARGGLAVRVAGTAAEDALVGQVVAAARAHDAGADVAALPAVDVAGFVALVRRAAVAVTNNSAGMHVADAVGTPVAVTHGGTERVTDMRPRAVASVLLAAPVPCSPCRQLRCPYDHECLDVAPERVADAALALADPDRGPAALREEDPWWTTNALTSDPGPRTAGEPVPAA